jgi:hypothetical protein
MIAEPLATCRAGCMLGAGFSGERRLDIPSEHGTELGKFGLRPSGHVNIYPYSSGTGAPDSPPERAPARLLSDFAGHPKRAGCNSARMAAASCCLPAAPQGDNCGDFVLCGHGAILAVRLTRISFFFALSPQRHALAGDTAGLFRGCLRSFASSQTPSIRQSLTKLFTIRSWRGPT